MHQSSVKYLYAFFYKSKINYFIKTNTVPGVDEYTYIFSNTI